MKKFVLILCAVGFVFLVVGSALTFAASSGNSMTIPNYGRVVANPEESQISPASEVPLDKVGYVTVLASVGFFAVAFLYNRKSSTSRPACTGFALMI